MEPLKLSADEVLTTTRAVRKRLDFERPVELDVLRECLQIALQAPTGSNAQGWHFVIVTDPQKRATIAEYYLKAFDDYEAGPFQPTKQHLEDPTMASTQARVLSSARYLADNLAQVPALLIPCLAGRPDTPGLPQGIVASMYGSILPAVWNFMLAARERGLGTCWTTLHLNYEQDIAKLLDIPDEFAQVALIPIAYTRGTDFKAGPRKDIDSVLHMDGW